MQESNVCKCEKMPFSHKSQLSTNLHSFCLAQWLLVPVCPGSLCLGLIILYLYSSKLQSTRCARSKYPPFPKDLALTAISEGCRGVCRGPFSRPVAPVQVVSEAWKMGSCTFSVSTESSVSEPESLDESESLNLQVHLQSLGVLSGTHPGDRGI